MRQSINFTPTLKEVSSDTQMPSHILMLRAGLVRQLASGVFSWLPMGWKVLKKIQNILREEIDVIGGQEFHLPALNPIEIWEATGRVEAMGDVMFHLKNRDGLVLAPTHEEIMTTHAKQHIQSYRDMPQIWYQIQSKFRNEPRPRSGVLRGRQFFMKDSYSLDSSWEGLDISYQKHYEAYKSIFDRCGIKFFVVGASSGAMGGSKSQEFMVESDFGEDVCAICDESDYAANIEVATSGLKPNTRKGEELNIEIFDTPNSKTINELVNDFNLLEQDCAKSVVYIINDETVLILMRGNDELNESKLESEFKTNKLRPATNDELIEFTGASGGSIGPINLKSNKIKVFADLLLENCNGLISGANIDGKHFKNIDLNRDAKIEKYCDFRTVKAGEPCPISGKPLRVVKAIELGHIFKLGTKYSDALSAKFLDVDGSEKSIIMGSYGIGVERILACFIEQNHDDRGIVWSNSINPYQVHLIGLNLNKSPEVKEASEEIYSTLISKGVDVIYDDRDLTPGYKFNDADLIGLPVQIIVGSKSLADGNVEIKYRKSNERKLLPLSEVYDDVLDYVGLN